MKESKRMVVCAAVCLGILAGIVPALAAEKAGPPAPGPEVKKLEYFVGKWSGEAEMKESPMGPGGKLKMKDTCDWFEGGYAVVCQSEGKGPLGAMKGIGIMSYSPDAKAYTYYGVDNTGMIMTTVPRGTVEGNTWTYTDESMMGGKSVKSRYTIKQESPSVYTFKWEVQGEDGQWASMMEGKNKRK